MDLQDIIALFANLGLTVNQAKTYLAAVSQPPCTSKQISKAANLPTEVVYRTMPALIEIGLIQKRLTHPTKFEATSLKQAIGILTERREKQNFEIRTKTDDLFLTLSQQPEEIVNSGLYITSVIAGRERLLQLTERKMQLTKKSLSMVGPERKLYKWLVAHRGQFQKLLDRNIVVQSIIVKSNTSIYPKELMSYFLKYGNFRIAFSQTALPASLVLFDDREVLLSTSVEAQFAQTPAYYSDVPDFVALCRFYFETCWNKLSNNK